ncbi:MAG: M48 family metallopeptidase [Deltaproteobacteria bacterium]|jgi:Zn-dependent protease with chaperone function|nr:M48 family metallopeptidase [Deltaproteobacteria bacterium]
MNFFQRQDVARRKSGYLVVCFVICVVLITIALYLGVVAFSHYIKLHRIKEVSHLWDTRMFVGVGIGTIFVIAIGSLYKVLALRKGGDAVATMLGATLVNSNSDDLQKQKLLNIVEEMAIASGTPVPSVYIMEGEHGINAFAAGFTPGSAIVCVTRGSLEVLSRDELQGVIAHEFSHIINGDMRLNIKLMGVVHGILVIAIIGRILMRTRGKKNPLPLLGLIFLVIGYIGVLFGKLIKAAISRQREFLSDASAVQFTRNPDGIGGALKKIGGLFNGSKLKSARADEASHFFFSNGLKKSFIKSLSTHPDLSERIRRIDPSFDGKFPKVLASIKPSKDKIVKGVHSAKGDEVHVQPAEILGKVGELSSKNIVFASALLSALSPVLRKNAHEPFGARAVIYALLINRERNVETSQLKLLEKDADSAVYQEMVKILPKVRQAGPKYRLPLVDISLPALKNLSDKQYAVFRKNVKSLVDADSRMDLFEFMLEKILFRGLDPCFMKVRPTEIRYRQIFNLRTPCRHLLSVVAHFGNRDRQSAISAFDLGKSKFGLGANPFEMLPEDMCTLDALGKSLGKLSQSSPKLKKNILDAVITCITADREICIEESELIRAIADTLDCPVPPLTI